MTYGHNWVRWLDIHIEEDYPQRMLRITVDRHRPGAVIMRRDMAITDDVIEHMDQVEALVVSLAAVQAANKVHLDEVKRQDAQLDRYRQSDRDWRWRDWINSWRMVGLAYAADTGLRARRRFSALLDSIDNLRWESFVNAWRMIGMQYALSTVGVFV